MNNFFKENLNILVVVLVIIFGAYFLSFNNGDKEEFDIKENGGVVSDLKFDAEKDKEKEDTIIAEKPKTPVVDPLQEKFGVAIDKGSKAFLEKDYDKAISYYNEALTYMESGLAYNRLYDTYNVLGNVDKAIEMINKAINTNSSNSSYWITKIQYLNEKTNTSYAELRKIYEEGYAASKTETKVNLVTAFARISENNNQKAEAIALWEQAKDLYPERKDLYQAEIDRLNK